MSEPSFNAGQPATGSQSHLVAVGAAAAEGAYDSARVAAAGALPAHAAVPSTQALSAGALLKQARESQGLHIAALAAAMKVPQRKLEALEADRWEQLPDATFVRALAQTVCRVLKIDAKPVLELLPPPSHPTFDSATKALNTPMQAPASVAQQAKGVMSGLADSGLRPLSLAALVLAGAALVMFLTPASYWRGLFGSGAATSSAATAARTANASQTVPPAAGAGPGPVIQASPAGALSVADTAPVAPAVASAPMAALSAASAALSVGTAPAGNEGTPVGASQGAGASGGAGVVAGIGAATVAVAPSPSAVASAATFGDNFDPAAPIQMAAAKDAWVTVVDANQRRIVDAMLRPGKKLSIRGKAPFSLVVGNSNQVSLSYKGKSVDLAASSNKNVARLQLP